MKLKHKIIIISLATITLISYTNCNKVSFSNAYSPESVTAACSNLANLQNVSFQVFIPNPLPQSGGKCPWPTSGEDSLGNVPMLESNITARIEQKISLAQFDGKIVCSLDISTPQTAFKYDDEFIITLNDRMLASSWYYPGPSGYPTIPNDPEVPLYDWFNIRKAQTYNNGIHNYFCLGGPFSSTPNPGLENFCHWPATEQNGVMTLNFNPEKIQSIISSMAYGENFYLNFITVGDNNPESDCRHNDLYMNITATVTNP